MTPTRRADRGLLVAGILAAVVLAAGSTVTLATLGGAFGGQLASRTFAPTGRAAAETSCATPKLAGTIINVTLLDRGGMMGGQPGRGQMMRGQYGSGPMMGGTPPGMGMARVLANPATVRAGTVSLRVVNQGAATHELVVLPLPAGQRVGTRPVDANGQVDERGSLGEASRSCGAGEGDGITTGATGWVTLTLPAGRYELICNLPGHYQAGMYSELNVT
jgi:uncharacterized cupredoxin-like copper-binding protein